MAMIKCPECGKDFSDKASACPNCGCPVSEILSTMDNTSFLAKPTSKTIQKQSIIQIDETNRKFRIKGAIAVNGKKAGLLGAAAKGLFAISTLYMSVAAEKAMGLGKKKVGSKEWFDFEDLVSYELLEDDAIVTSGGVGQALIGGFAFGGAGMIAGRLTGKRIQKKNVLNLSRSKLH